MSVGTLVSIQVGLPRTITDPPAPEKPDGAWRSAIWKLPVNGPVQAQMLGLVGDGQADLRLHGGVDHAILGYAADHYPSWRAVPGLEAMTFGGFGENLCWSNIDETTVCIGDQYRIGPVRLEVSQPRQPCAKLVRRWQKPELAERVIATARGGWYLRVLDPGALEAGMPIELLDRPFPQWSIRRVFNLLYHEDDAAAMAELAMCPSLSVDWRKQVYKRLGRVAS